MIKILAVDDEMDMELLIKQKFRTFIREEKYEFIFALNGNDAINKLKENPDVDIILCDINMPEMDGLTLLSKLPEFGPMVKSIMVSAYGDMENIRVAMNRGAFDFICKPVDFTDLQLTIEKTIQYVAQIKKMLQAVKENDILKMYVDGNVLKFMGNREFESALLKNETIEATVAFIDICGFTAISENESPDFVVKLLNSYFDIIVKEIIEQGGYIDKFIGDAILAVFKGNHHLDRTIEACLAIRKQIEKIPGRSDKSNFSPHVSAGINSGEMICGNIGSAKLRRLDYTVIGDVVNTAQRLLSIAAKGQILINEICFDKVKQSFTCKNVGLFHIKHKVNEVNVYEVLE